MGTHGLIKVTRITLQPSEPDPALIGIYEEFVEQRHYVEQMNKKIKAAIDARKKRNRHERQRRG